MFMRPRRPLLGAAMLGGTFMAGRASQRAAYREADQEERIEELEGRPTSAPPPGPAPGSAPAAVAPGPAQAAASPAGTALVAQLNQLSSLKQSGALSDEEFEAAKQKLLAG